jgi:hypothetical protein
MSKSLVRWASAAIALIWSGFSALATVYDSDGSSTNVQYIHDTLAQNGDTITIPEATFTWSQPVRISKAIKLKGQGSGRIIGDTRSSITIGTGSKTFTTTKVIPGIVPGETLRINKMLSHSQYMLGTVSSYSGTTLVIDITEAGGSGTYTSWWIATQPTTTVLNAYNNGCGNNNGCRPMIAVNENAAGSVEISGIQFRQLAGNNSALSASTHHSGFHPRR